MRRFALLITVGGIILLPQPSGAQAAAPSAAAVDSALVFGPARGSLVVQLLDSAHHAPLVGGFVELHRSTARFEPSHFPNRFAPTEFSGFEDVPAGPYVLTVRRIGYMARSIAVVVRAGGPDTVTVVLDFYRGCDFCEVVPRTTQQKGREALPTASDSVSKTKKP